MRSMSVLDHSYMYGGTFVMLVMDFLMMVGVGCGQLLHSFLQGYLSDGVRCSRNF